MSLDKLDLEREALAPDLVERFHAFESAPDIAYRHEIMFLRETVDHAIKPHLDGLTKIRWSWLVKCLVTTGLVAGTGSAAYFVMHWINGFFAPGLSDLWIAWSVAAGLAVWFVLWLKPWINDTDLEAH
jgi:hypothetical protein